MNMYIVCVLRPFSCIRLFATSWTIACQAPLSMGCCWQEYQSGMPCLPPGDLPHQDIEPVSPLSPALQADSLLLRHQGSPICLLSIQYLHLFL